MKNNSIWIAPSILSADFARLGEEVKTVVAAGADLIHIDVMDHHFVPNLTIGPMVCSALRKFGIQTPFDVHLMVTPVDPHIAAFAKAGANYISFHPEATQHVHRTIQLIREYGCHPAIALNPATPIDCLQHVYQDIDMVLVMSVNPGFGGQKFIPQILEKIKMVRIFLTEKKANHIRLEVDGGVQAQNIQAISEAGADTFVAGTAIFKAPDYAEVIRELRHKAK